MNLTARISRLEQQQGSGNPLEALTDEELAAAIDARRKTIEAETGMSEKEYAEWLSARLLDGTLPEHLDPIVIRQFVAAVMAEVNGKTRTAHA